jgi:glycosyltransferase involved in cell wall biosynthesis
VRFCLASCRSSRSTIGTGLRILFIQRNTIWGGSIRSLYWLGTTLATEHEVFLGYFGSEFPEYAQDYAEAGIQLVPLGHPELEQRMVFRSVRKLRLKRGAPTLLALPRLVLDIPLRRRVPSLIQLLRPDVVHTNESPRINRAEINAARSCGVPVVAHVRRIMGVSAGDRRAALKTARLIPVSDAAARPYREAGVPDSMIRVIHNSVPIAPLASIEDRRAWRAELGLADGACWAVTSGRLIRLKGNMEAIRAVALVREHGLDLRLLMLGKGPEESALADEIRRLGLADAVVFAGWRNDLSRIIPAVDLALLPSQHDDAFPRSVIEAMAYALPVVATEYGGAQEAFVDGVSGVLVRGRGPETMAEGLTRLAGDAALRARMGHEARALAVRRFSPEAHAARVLDVYNEAVNGPGDPDAQRAVRG